MAKQKKKYFKLKFSKVNLLPVALFIILFTLTFFTYQVFIADKYYPFTLVGDSNISFLTEGQAIRKVQLTFEKRKEQKLQFSGPQGLFFIDLATSSAKLDYSTLDQAFNSRKQFQALLFKSILFPKVSLSLDKQSDTIALAIGKEPQNAQLLFNETTTLEGSPSAQIQIKEAVAGLSLDREKIEKEITRYLLAGKYQINLPIQVVSPKITTQHVQRAKEALERSQTQPLNLKFEGRSWIIDTKQLLTLLDLTKGGDLLLDKDKTYVYLSTIAKEIDQEVQEGLFEFNPTTKRVTAFKPSQEGRNLNLDQTYQLIIDAKRR